MTPAQPASNLGGDELSQLLQAIDRGQYIAWQADPAASCTPIQALYDAGWSGIAIRPVAAPDAARRRETVLTFAALQAGSAAFGQPHVLHVAAGAGFAEAWRMLGMPALQPWLVLVHEPLDAAERLLAAACYRCLARGVYASSRHPEVLAPAHRPASLATALAVAEARLASSQRRMLDAVTATGQARRSIGLMHEESAWLRGVAERAMANEANLRAEVGWLRDCLADSRAQTASAHAEAARLHAAVATLEQWQPGLERRLLRRAVYKLLALRRPPLTPLAPMAEAPLIETQQEAQPEPLPEATPLPPELPPPPPAASAALRTAVHQFHAGSAQGDAITNAMLLIRSLLRGAGFRSEIFVETRGHGLGPDIQLMDALPAHDGYVLLVHHSMGLDEIGRICALAAPKILIYHNITPPGLLAHLPKIQRLADLGRQQLATYRAHTVYALADSAYSAVELRRHGFPAVRTCTLLFDTAALASQAAGPRAPGGPFTVLFVGRITPSKGQADLVDAFALFSRQWPAPSRLVLVGTLDPDEHAYIEDIERRAAAAGVADAVHLTGSIPDGERDGWYREAGLYVSLSLHEGFGVPLVEAMAHGVPILALAAAAVPYTLGQAGTLLHSRDPGQVAAAMLAAAQDPAPDRARGPAELHRFGLAHHLPVLWGALAAAGAPLPAGPAERAAIAARLQVTVAGHVNGTYSLAAVNRSLARTLEAARPGTIRLIPVEGGPTTYLDGVPEPERPGIAALAGRDAPLTGPELVVSGHYPLHVPAAPGDLLAAMFFWEEALIPAATVATLNADFGAVFAPSRFVAKALVDSGVATPVITIGYAPELAPFLALPPRRERQGRFTFLHVSSAFPRKGVDVLLAAWAQAFTAADPVCLVIKCFPNPHNDAAGQIARLQASHPALAPITLVDRDLPADELLALYRESEAAVLPTRGEGYNIPAAEAMAAGLPLIVTGHGGHLDFCSPSTARLVAYSVQPSASHLASPHSFWAEPDVGDLAAAMRQMAAGVPDGQVARARCTIAAAASGSAVAARLTDAAAALLAAPPAPPVRTAWVTPWAVRCGVAEYSRALLGALPRTGLADPLILADDRAAPGRHVQPAWALGLAGIDRLLAALASADPEIVMIQHQPGLLPWPTLGAVLAALAAAGRVAVATLHNTRHLLEIAGPEREAALAGLHQAARILVHTIADIRTLDGLGLAARSTLLPHAAPPAHTAAIRPLHPGDAPLIGCTGFFLPGKGIPALIAATAALRTAWPGARLRLVNAEYDASASAAEIATARNQAAAAGLPVEWHTGFLSLDAQRALLQGCDVLALPYAPSKESSSAALRSALASGVPVAVTPIALFEEAGAAVFRFPGSAPAAIAEGLAALLADTRQRTNLAEAGRAWLGERSLPAIATRLHGMLLGLAAQQRIGAPLDGGLWALPAE